MSVGMRAGWVQRRPEDVFDPWGQPPTVLVTSLNELALLFLVSEHDRSGKKDDPAVSIIFRRPHCTFYNFAIYFR